MLDGNKDQGTKGAQTLGALLGHVKEVASFGIGVGHDDGHFAWFLE